MKLFRAVMVAAVLAAPSIGLFAVGAPASAKERLAYEVQEARAYAYKASLNKQEIEAINTVQPCDPKTHKYKCDYATYAHQPNCPEKIDFGPDGKVPLPTPSKETDPLTGGAGDHAGDLEPPQGPPVRLNYYMALGSLSRVPGSEDSTGIGAKSYVDLSGARDQDVFSNTDAFTPNQRSYEERCWPKANAKSGNDFTHVMSHSEKSLHTYHYSECYRRDCTFQAPSPGTFGATAEHARSITDLREINGRVVGSMSSVVEDLDWGDGALTVDSVRTYLQFQSDGTAEGLKWSVVSSAQGVKIGGQPVSLPPGKMISLPGGAGAVGMAAPYVDASKDGASLTIVQGGLTIAHDQQAAYFAGGEVYASFGTAPVSQFQALATEPSDPGVGGNGAIGGGGDTGTTGGYGSTGTTVAGGGTGKEFSAQASGSDAGGEGELLVYTVATGRGGVTAILFGALAFVLLLGSRWIQRFAWGRAMSRAFPFKTIDWLYRAFVKT
ncbi:MAG TPA: hypothetical protein VFK89_11310 [Actinomycetota bacterium]|nr:hypothetical protein [Actinomycetota bacterium]